MITTTMTTVMVPTAIPATDTEAVTDITESTAVTAMVVMDFRDMVAFMEEAFTDLVVMGVMVTVDLVADMEVDTEAGTDMEVVTGAGMVTEVVMVCTMGNTSSVTPVVTLSRRATPSTTTWARHNIMVTAGSR